MFSLFAPKNEDERLAKRVLALEERIDALDRTVKSLKLEWEESYDKLHHLMSRVTKRALTASRENQDDPQGRPDAQGEQNSQQTTLSPTSILGTHARLQAMRSRNGLLPR